jgi:hypothetical protein
LVLRLGRGIKKLVTEGLDKKAADEITISVWEFCMGITISVWELPYN